MKFYQQQYDDEDEESDNDGFLEMQYMGKNKEMNKNKPSSKLNSNRFEAERVIGF
mgnify:CR=1 FL=1